MRLNTQLQYLKPSPIRSFNDQIADIEGLLPLTIGQPDFNTPQFIKEAAITAINEHHNGYTHSRGMLSLREAVTRYLQRKYNLTYNAETEILITAGPTQALLSTLMTLLNQGEKVATPSPNYVIYTTQASLAYGELVPIDVSQTNFILTPELLEETMTQHPETTVLLLNFPSNPTGVTYNREQLAALIPVIEKYDLWVVSDEIYSELTYNQQHISIAKLLPERTLLINGASKSHAMTGWRSGFIAGPEWVISQLFKIHQATINTPNTPMQYASIVAYDDGDDAISEMRDIYQQRRDFLTAALQKIGIETLQSEGAFYLFAKVPEWFNGNDVDFCLALAQQAKVGVVPGSGFGEAGKQYFRLSYAASLDTLQEAARRIADFVTTNKI